MKKKYLILGVCLLALVECFRGLYYKYTLKTTYMEVIEYIETNRQVDDELVFQLENKGIKLEYSYEYDEIDLKLSKKHIILFLIDTNVSIHQKYILSRLNN